MKQSPTLGYLLGQATNAMIVSLNRQLAPLGLNHAQFVILKHVKADEGISQRALAAQLHKDPAAISRSLRSLEEKGLIERRGVNGTKNGLYLTDKTNEIRDAFADAIVKSQAQATAGMTPEEIASGMDFLIKVFNNSTQSSE